jgi:hypothetical protein
MPTIPHTDGEIMEGKEVDAEVGATVAVGVSRDDHSMMARVSND